MLHAAPVAAFLLKHPDMRLAISALFSATFTVLTLAAPAGAQVPPATPTTRAPAMVDAEEPRHPLDADISQINGVPIPVGSHNEYHYSFKRWIVSTNPLGWMLGSYGVSMSYGMHRNVALRVDANYYQPVDTQDQGVELGAGLPIYFRRTYQGPFLEPGFVVRHLEYGDSPGDPNLTNIGPQMLLGWHWMFDSGLNIAIAAGVGRNLALGERTDVDNPHDTGTFANGYMRFGYAF